MPSLWGLDFERIKIETERIEAEGKRWEQMVSPGFRAALEDAKRWEQMVGPAVRNLEQALGGGLGAWLAPSPTRRALAAWVAGPTPAPSPEARAVATASREIADARHGRLILEYLAQRGWNPMALPYGAKREAAKALAKRSTDRVSATQFERGWDWLRKQGRVGWTCKYPGRDRPR